MLVIEVDPLCIINEAYALLGEKGACFWLAVIVNGEHFQEKKISDTR